MIFDPKRKQTSINSSPKKNAKSSQPTFTNLSTLLAEPLFEVCKISPRSVRTDSIKFSPRIVQTKSEHFLQAKKITSSLRSTTSFNQLSPRK